MKVILLSDGNMYAMSKGKHNPIHIIRDTSKRGYGIIHVGNILFNPDFIGKKVRIKIELVD